jgi:hypothetical protein
MAKWAKEEVKENVINIDGKGYKETDLSQQQKYLIAQLKDLGIRAGKLRADLDQVQRASDSFQEDLLKSFKEVSDETSKEAEAS